MVASDTSIMILTCSKLITCKASTVSTVVDKGALLISKGTIESLGSAKFITKRFRGHRIIDLPNTVVIPGLINTHTHLELPPNLIGKRTRTFPDWILHLIHAKRNLNQKHYLVFAAHNIGALIRSGSTTVGEICTHGVSAGLLMQSGLRAIVFDEIINMGQSLRIRSPLRSRSVLLQNGLSPHSPYTVSEQDLRSISCLSRKHAIRLTMHIAESMDEVRLLQGKKSGLEKIYEFAKWDLSRAPKGPSPIEYLQRSGVLSSRLLAVHCVHLSADDIRLVKKSGTAVAHCPRSNTELGVGKMPLKKMLDAGITVGLGTDSLASVPTLNMWDEMRYAYKIHKKDGVKAEDIVKIATIGGARALGLDKEIGTLEPGKKADIIAVPLPKKNTGDLYSDLLRETNSCIMSMVNGKILYHR